MRAMRRDWLGWFLFQLCSVLCLLVSVAVVAASASERRSSPAPDGVCYPVNGTGYMVTHADGLKIPIGTLSPLVEGDSLVVMSGTITFVDFRTRQSPVYGVGTRLQIPPVKKPKRPSWWKRLEDHIVRSLSGPELGRIGGSVRGGKTAFWPDSAWFAPDVAIVFQWRGVRPAPAVLRVYAGSDTTEYYVSQGPKAHGVFAWRPETPIPAGPVAWVLLDADREVLGGGHMVILTTEIAEAERERFRSAAIKLDEPELLDLMTAVLAHADRAYLW